MDGVEDQSSCVCVHMFLRVQIRLSRREFFDWLTILWSVKCARRVHWVRITVYINVYLHVFSSVYQEVLKTAATAEDAAAAGAGGSAGIDGVAARR